MSYYRKTRLNYGGTGADTTGTDGGGDVLRSVRRVRGSLGDVASTIVTAATVVQDPYFNETVCRVGQLEDIEAKRPVRGCATIPDGYQGGVGLRKAMPALRAYVYAEQHPWVYPAAIGAVLGLPALLGYLFGKGSR